MTSTSVTVLTALIAWALFLLILIEGLRSRFVVTEAVAANEFKPDNSNLTPFIRRALR